MVWAPVEGRVLLSTVRCIMGSVGRGGLRHRVTPRNEGDGSHGKLGMLDANIF